LFKLSYVMHDEIGWGRQWTVRPKKSPLLRELAPIHRGDLGVCMKVTRDEAPGIDDS